jgi:hypothetical protein
MDGRIAYIFGVKSKWIAVCRFEFAPRVGRIPYPFTVEPAYKKLLETIPGLNSENLRKPAQVVSKILIWVCCII